MLDKEDDRKSTRGYDDTVREWLRYEWHILKRGVSDTWRALKPSSGGDWVRGGIIISVTIAALYLGGNIALAQDEMSFQMATLLGLFAALVLTFLFNVAVAPFRHDVSRMGELSGLESKIDRLSDELRIHTQNPNDMDKLPILQAVEMLPKDEAGLLLQEGAYKQRFVVFGREMKAVKFPADPHYEVSFDTGARQERKIPFSYFEDGVFILDQCRSTELSIDGSFKPYTAKDVPIAQTLYTDLFVGKDQFEVFVSEIKSRWPREE